MTRTRLLSAGAFGMALVAPVAADVNVAPGAKLTVAGTLTATGTVQAASTGTVAGTGAVVAGATVIDGILTVDPSPGILTVADVVVNATGSVELAVDGAGTPGVDHDQLKATNTLTLNSPALTLTGLGVAPLPGGEIVIIDNAGGSSVSGTFSSLPEEAPLTLPTSGTTVYISYAGGDGNDVILTLLDNDGDGLIDPNDPDDDNDGIPDANELAGQDAGGNPTGFGPTDPLVADSDGDGTGDAVEAAVGSNPNNAASTPCTDGLTVSTEVDESDGDFLFGDLSLREAIEILNGCAASAPAPIGFDAALDGKTIALLTDLAFDGKTVTLDGTGLTMGVTIQNGGGALIGTGEVVKAGSDLVILDGSHNFVGGASVREGTLGLAAADAAGAGTISFVPILEENFDSTEGLRFSTNGVALIEGGSARLTPVAQGQLGSIISEILGSEPIASFETSFEFTVGGGNGADGFSFALLNAANYGGGALFGEGGPGANALSISFDTYRVNPAGGNHVRLVLNGAVVADVLVGFTLNDGQTHRADIVFDGSALTMTLTPAVGAPETPFASVPVPGFTPYLSRLGFGARTGGATDEHRIDTVLFRNTSTTATEPVLRYADGISVANVLELRNAGIAEVASGNTATQAGAIGETGGSFPLTKTGGGVLSLPVANAYSGGTVIADGTLAPASDAAMGVNGAPVTFAGGTLRYPDGTNGAGRAFITTSTWDARFELNAGAGNLLGGTSISGPGSLIKTGPAILNLQAACSYQGSTEVLQGILDVSGLSERIPDTSAVVLSANTQFRFFTANLVETIGSLSGDGLVRLAGADQHLLVGADDQSTVFSGQILASFGGDGQVTKLGNGTLTLSGANTYGKGTTVTSGTLLVSNSAGSGTGSGAVIVQSGAILGGDGSVAGAITISNGATIAPGTSVGTLTAGSDVTLDGGTYSCEIDGASVDKLEVVGNLDITNGLLNVSVSGSANPPAFVIASYGSLTGDPFAGLAGLPIGYTVDYAYNDGVSSNNIALVRPLTAYEAWALANGLSFGVNDGFNDDPNLDGDPNIEHFGLDTNPLGTGGTEGKQRGLVHDLGGGSLVFTLTAPIRTGAIFSGAGVNPTLTVDGIVYTINGDADLVAPYSLAVDELNPALSSGLPALNPNYEYRTFRLQDLISTQPEGFLFIEISGSP